MQRRCLHILLCLLVLAQPVAGAAASVTMVGASLDSAAAMDGHDMSGMDMPGMEMTGCHDAAPAIPDCCAEMDGVSCGMDCGTASPAIAQALLLASLNGHGAFEGHAMYAAPSHSPNTFLKPPRTS